MDQVGQYGRWLIATVAAAHFGGLVLVAQLAERLPTADLRSTMWCLIAGLVAIFISGLVTYYNWGYSGRFFALHTNVRLLIDPGEPLPNGSRELKMMTVTQFAAIGLGVASVAFIPLAAWQLPL
ncbi:hypothetical protein SAMN02983003_0703 [Devosia enhydra]|uniref:Uncharacterized protein n=1 Tax=Devosia enhydra TaxID=665118 RepID=A0A1K2HTY2_9HYPH|nr:hypothetical protein [Devosia enhydra]SFZ81807.1 hypothetical protein SAMN02983003_0703 [Devosia enhydra]